MSTLSGPLNIPNMPILSILPGFIEGDLGAKKVIPRRGEGNDTGSNQATLLSDHVLSDPAAWLFTNYF